MAGWRASLCGAVVAATALAAIAAAPAAEPSDPSPFVTDGPVYAMTSLGGDTYVGGAFAHVARRSGTGVVLHTTGDNASLRDAAFPEFAGGEVDAVAPDGAGGWYVGGSFTSVGGTAIAGLAHLKHDGAVDPDFHPDPRMQDGSVGSVRAIAVGPTGSADEGVVYVGGGFERIAGKNDPHLAAVSPNGQVLNWSQTPQPSDDVDALAVLPVTIATGGAPRSESVVFAGGDFGKPSGAALPGQVDKPGLAAVWGAGAKVDVTDQGKTTSTDVGGEELAWDGSMGGLQVRALALGPPVKKDASSPTQVVVYGGGAWSSGGPAPLQAVQFQIGADGTVQGTATRYFGWLATPPDGTVRALALHTDATTPANSTLYAGGDFQNAGGSARKGLVALPPITDPGCASTFNCPTGAPAKWDPAQKVADAPSVRTLAVSGDGSTVYAGGAFDELGAGDSPPARGGLAAVGGSSVTDASGGGAASEWDPAPAGGPVGALALGPGDSEVFAGGSFTGVAAVPRDNLAAFHGSGNLAAWNPGADDTVHALAAQGSTIYAGGNFTHITPPGGAPVALARLAALDGAGNPLPGFQPVNPDGSVLALSTTSDALYVGGGFTTVANEAHARLAALDLSTGAPLRSFSGDANDTVYSLDASCSTVYAGGAFTAAGGHDRSGIAALDPATGAATDWDPDSNSAVYAVRRFGDVVYAGGRFSRIGLEPRSHIAALDPASGKATSWNPSGDLDSVRALAVDANTVYAGGLFTSIGDADRDNVAALDPATGEATTWNPRADRGVYALSEAGGVLGVGGAFTGLGPRTQQGFGAFVTGTPPEATAAPCHKPAPPVLPARPAPPSIALFRMSHRAFRVGRAPTLVAARRGRGRPRDGRRKPPPVGTTFRYRLSAPAVVTLTIQRRRFRQVLRLAGRLSRHGLAALNRIRFSGRIGRRALRPGRYVATLGAIDSSDQSAVRRRLSFRIVR